MEMMLLHVCCVRPWVCGVLYHTFTHGTQQSYFLLLLALVVILCALGTNLNKKTLPTLPSLSS